MTEPAFAATIKVFKHKDVKDCERILQSTPAFLEEADHPDAFFQWPATLRRCRNFASLAENTIAS